MDNTHGDTARRDPFPAADDGWRVVWVGPPDLSLLQALRATAQAAGAVLVPYPPATLPEGGADARVLIVRSFPDAAALRRELRRDTSPVLFLAEGVHEAEQAHEAAGTHDDVESAQAPAHLVWRRLERMHDRLAALELARDSSRRDELTGLLTRGVAETEWPAVAAHPTPVPLWLFVLDLDHFKQVNDRHGHAAGDLVLKHVAAVLQEHVPSPRRLCRLGGEEFAWLVEGLDPLGCEDHAEEVLQALRELRHEAGADVFSVTGSIGYARVDRHEPLADAFRAADEAVYAAKAAGRDQAQAREQMDTLAAQLDSDVQLMHFENVTRVVTERTANLLSNFGRNLVQQAQQAADQDKLTQVWNRRYFDRRLERELKLAQAHGTPLAIAVFDLDHFGQFNRTYGMPTGDAVLREFARLALTCTRATDWFARYGGEEFVLVVRGSQEDAVAVAERIRGALERAVIAQPSGEPVRCTVSVGVAALEPDIAEPVHLVQRASKRLQAAKRQGRNQVVAESAA